MQTYEYGVKVNLHSCIRLLARRVPRWYFFLHIFDRDYTWVLLASLSCSLHCILNPAAKLRYHAEWSQHIKNPIIAIGTLHISLTSFNWNVLSRERDPEVELTCWLFSSFSFTKQFLRQCYCPIVATKPDFFIFYFYFFSLISNSRRDIMRSCFNSHFMIFQVLTCEYSGDAASSAKILKN